MAIDEMTKIVSHDEAAPGYRFLVLDAPRLAEALTPGQFVHVRIPGLEASALRRPFSVFDAHGGQVTVMYKIVGRGTEALAHAQPGDGLSVLGPLGHGFPTVCEGVPLLVGGGYGVAPLHFLARRLNSPRTILFEGGRTKGDLLALDRFAALGVDVRTATNDGSAGVKGFVTEPLDDVLVELCEKKEKFELFTCGPDGLLKAVAMRATGSGRPGWISMDRHMICGVGACFACIQKIKGPDGQPFNARCCVNGPVFKASDLIWE
ncbi:MAG: dihydroorotate dehydrogenase electron transfer subunit [Kiritimatiellia bacterium]